jgi:hypothetical protein
MTGYKSKQELGIRPPKAVDMQRISFAAVYVSARPGRLPPPSGDIAEEDVKTSSSFYQVC